MERKSSGPVRLASLFRLLLLNHGDVYEKEEDEHGEWEERWTRTKSRFVLQFRRRTRVKTRDKSILPTSTTHPSPLCGLYAQEWLL